MVASIMDHAHAREAALRLQAQNLSGVSPGLAQLEAFLADRLLDDVIKQQADALSRAADSVVDGLCEAEVGLSSPSRPTPRAVDEGYPAEFGEAARH